MIYQRLVLMPVLFLLGCGGERVTDLRHLESLSEEVIVKELGPPAFDKEFALDTSRGYSEYEAGVAARYPLHDPATEGVAIRELRWNDNDSTTTAFLHKVGDRWKVLDAFRWSNGTQF